MHAAKDRGVPQRLRLDCADPNDYRVVTVFGVAYDPSPDGRVTIVTPNLRNCSFFFLGVRYRDGRPERNRWIQVVKGTKVIRRLSLEDLKATPVDEDGYHEVRLQK